MISDINCVISAYGENGLIRAKKLIEMTNELFRRTILVINEEDRLCESIRLAGSYCEIRRPNLGMNIGAWLSGIKMCEEGYPVICLQDECELASPDAPQRYSKLLREDGVGMVGESLNTKWDRTWEAMRRSSLNYGICLPNQGETPRVEFYLQCMQDWGIHSGKTAVHLRSLACGFPWSVASHLPDLPLSNNKEQCIAAEIGISKFVANNLGLSVIQSGARPFSYFSHPEWHPNGLSKISNWRNN